MGAEVEVRVRIVLRERDGLGNKLFQYAALLYYGRRYAADMHIAVDPEWNAQCNGYPRPCLLSRFSEGLETKVVSSGSSISLGQKQLIAFMRAALRSPELLILDEATANIDTVTEQLLEEILARLPEQTTKVIIAHRLNTIDKVDQIFFVNSGAIALAGSMEHALEMLLHEKRAS